MREGFVTIELTSPSLAGRIREAREKLDSWLKKLSAPPAGQVQSLRLAGFSPRNVSYELILRGQVSTENRTIL